MNPTLLKEKTGSLLENETPMNLKQEEPGWTAKGATLTDKTAEKEFGLTAQDVLVGIRSGKLQYRETSMYGNPCLRLLRQEVEALVTEKYGAGYLQQKELQNELAEVNKTLRALKTKTRAMEKRKLELSELLANQEI
jgi:hypothetical protein